MSTSESCGLTTIAATGPPEDKVCDSLWPVSAFQRSSVPSKDPLRSVPSGKKARETFGEPCASSVRSAVPSMLCKRTCPSASPIATSFPSGANATAVAVPASPRRDTIAPVAVLQTARVRRPTPASNVPERENESDCTLVVSPVKARGDRAPDQSSTLPFTRPAASNPSPVATVVTRAPDDAGRAVQIRRFGRAQDSSSSPLRTTASVGVTASGGVCGTFGSGAGCAGRAKPAPNRRVGSSVQPSTVPSRLAPYRVFPSGEKATPFAAAEWPANVAIWPPVLGFHSVIVPSESAVAAVRPSGEKATASPPPEEPGPVAGMTRPVRRST